MIQSMPGLSISINIIYIYIYTSEQGSTPHLFLPWFRRGFEDMSTIRAMKNVGSMCAHIYICIYIIILYIHTYYTRVVKAQCLSYGRLSSMYGVKREFLLFLVDIRNIRCVTYTVGTHKYALNHV